MTVIARKGFPFHGGLFIAVVAMALAACGGSGGSSGGGGASGGGSSGGGDTTAPADVVNFTGTAGNTQVALTWVNPSDSDFAGVRICWSTTANPTSATGCGANYADVAQPATTHTITGLGSVATYFTAFSYDATPNYSSGVSITKTPTDTTAPADVSSFSGAAGNTQVALSWVNPADSDFAGVRICWSTSANPSDATACGTDHADVAQPATSYTVTGLANATTYFTAFSYDAAPNYSAGISITRTPSAVADTTPPANVTGLSGTAGSTQVALTWTNPADADFAGVRICWSTTASPTNPAACSTNFADVGQPATTKTVTGLASGTLHNFTAFAYDGAANYASGASITRTTSAGPAASITTPSGNQTIAVGSTVSFAESTSGGTGPYTYAWNFDVNGLGGAVPGTSTSATPGSVTFSTVGTYTVRLTVTDYAAATAQATLTVTTQSAAPAFSRYSNGAKWNDYVKNDGTGAADATGTACNAATDAPGYGACLHGGEIRAIPITGQSSCTGLTIADSLGAFNWICDGTVNPVRAVSTGLKDGKYLSDLLDFTTPGWKSNSITVQDATPSTVFTSTPAAWWTNPVVAANTGIATGTSVAGTVYVVNQDVTADYTIDSSKTALVVQPGKTVTASNPNYATVFVSTNSSTNLDFDWIEGAFKAKAAGYNAVDAELIRFTVLRKVNGIGPSAAGVTTYCHKSKFVDITASQANIGLALSARECSITNVTVDQSNNGISVADNTIASSSGGGNTLANVTVTNGPVSSGSPYALQITSNGNNVTGLSVQENYGTALKITGSSNTVTNISATDTGALVMTNGIVIGTSTSGNVIDDVTISGVSGSGPTGRGIDVSGTSHRLNNLRVSRAPAEGVIVSGSLHTVSNVGIENAGVGLRVNDGVRNRIWNVMVGDVGDATFGNTAYGYGLQTTSTSGSTRADNIISNVIIANSGLVGFYLGAAKSNVFQYMTIANTGHLTNLSTTQDPVSFGGRGMRVMAGSITGNMFNNMLAVNNADMGLDLDPHFTGTSTDYVTGMVFNDVAVVGNGKRSYIPAPAGIRLGTFAVDVLFLGELILANNGTDPSVNNCQVVHDSTVKINQGLTDSSVNKSCAPVGNSTATLDTSITGYGVIGAVASDDTVNGSDTGGVAALASILDADWIGFQNVERTWGVNTAAAFPDVNGGNWGVCPTGGNCRIYDWSLSSSDTDYLNRLPVPTGNDYLVHTFLAADAATCAQIPATWTGSVCQSTFLANAVEVMGDGIGNDNLLCESGETCIYMPNIGGYQGHGPLISAGAFTDGVVTGVTLLKYTTNGR